MGLYTPIILGGNSYLIWFYDWGAIKDPAHTGTSKGLSQAINRGPIRKCMSNYANACVTIQSHGLSAGARTHYVTANGVRDGLTGRSLDRKLLIPQLTRYQLEAHSPTRGLSLCVGVKYSPNVIGEWWLVTCVCSDQLSHDPVLVT